MDVKIPVGEFLFEGTIYKAKDINNKLDVDVRKTLFKACEEVIKEDRDLDYFELTDESETLVFAGHTTDILNNISVCDLNSIKEYKFTDLVFSNN